MTVALEPAFAQRPTGESPSEFTVPANTSLSPASAPPVSVTDLIGFAKIGSMEPNFPRQNSYAPFLPQVSDEIIWSPDASYVAKVVRRGNLKLNTVEGELLLFRASDLLSQPRGESLVKFSSSSPLPPIRAVRWINNKMLAFLAENPGDLPQVYTIDIETKVILKKTSAATKITRFDVSSDGNTVVYQAARANDPNQFRNDIARGFNVKNGVKLTFLMKGEYGVVSDSDFYQPLDMWKVEGNGRAEVLALDPSIFSPGLQYEFYIAPLGNWLLVNAPTVDPSKEWVDYKVEGKGFDLRGASQWRLVRISDGTSFPLIDAPIAAVPPGWSRPKMYQGQLLWAPDGKSVLLNSAWLPLGGTTGEERLRRVSNRYVVQVDLSSRTYSVLDKIEPNTELLIDY